MRVVMYNEITSLSRALTSTTSPLSGSTLKLSVPNEPNVILLFSGSYPSSVKTTEPTAVLSDSTTLFMSCVNTGGKFAVTEMK